MTRDCEHGRQIGKCADCDLALREEDLARYEDLVIRQGEALREIVNSIRGEPPEGTGWSTHDAVDLVRQQLKDDRWLLQRCLNMLETLPVKHPQQGHERGQLVTDLIKRLT